MDKYDFPFLDNRQRYTNDESDSSISAGESEFGPHKFGACWKKWGIFLMSEELGVIIGVLLDRWRFSWLQYKSFQM